MVKKSELWQNTSLEWRREKACRLICNVGRQKEKRDDGQNSRLGWAGNR